MKKENGISLVRKDANEAIDVLEAKMSEFDTVVCPLIHKFIDGQYVREIFMPAGSLITSRIHKTRHPYFILSGKVSVWIDNVGWQLIEAPYSGITEKGTRRILYIWEDCIWATVHLTDIVPENETDEEIQKAVDKLENMIIEKHDNYFLSETMKKKLLYNLNRKA